MPHPPPPTSKIPIWSVKLASISVGNSMVSSGICKNLAPGNFSEAIKIEFWKTHEGMLLQIARGTIPFISINNVHGKSNTVPEKVI